jgi:hypothetical protein
MRLVLIVLFCLVDVPGLMKSESTETFDDLGQAIHQPFRRRVIGSIRHLTRHYVRRPQTEVRLYTARTSRTIAPPSVRTTRLIRKIPLPVLDLPSQSEADHSLA